MPGSIAASADKCSDQVLGWPISFSQRQARSCTTCSSLVVTQSQVFLLRCALLQWRLEASQRRKEPEEAGFQRQLLRAQPLTLHARAPFKARPTCFDQIGIDSSVRQDLDWIDRQAYAGCSMTVSMIAQSSRFNCSSRIRAVLCQNIAFALSGSCSCWNCVGAVCKERRC